jgi:nucleoid DNA-binding protein
MKVTYELDSAEIIEAITDWMQKNLKNNQAVGLINFSTIPVTEDGTVYNDMFATVLVIEDI